VTFGKTHDIDALGDTSDPHILGLPDQDVQPGADSEHVDVFVGLFEADGTGGFGLVPSAEASRQEFAV
jgi:hypothetical protein